MSAGRMIMPKRTYLLWFAVFCFLKIYAQDTTPPVFVQNPISISLPCAATNIEQQFQSWYTTAGNAIVSDNNGGPIQLIGQPSFAEALAIFNASVDTLCGNTKNVLVEFYAQDQSGNVSLPGIAEFSTFDDVSPVITTSPLAFNGECIASSQNDLINWIKNKAGSVVSDGCSDTIIWTDFVYTTSTSQSGQSSINNGPYPTIPNGVCTWFVNVSFFFKDDCENMGATAIRKFEIKDTRPPVLSSTPANVTVSCNNVPSAPTITAQDECGGLINVVFQTSNTQAADANVCGHYNYIITRSWTATDNCNNSISHTQTINVIDNIKPSVVFSDTILIDCQYKNNIDSSLISYSDNCSSISITYQDSTINNSGCNNSIFRRYQARDVCNNTLLFTQLVNTEDKSAPEISSPAVNKSFGCNENIDLQAEFQLWLNAKAGSMATDRCNLIKSFYAEPGSYILSDTSTFPGVTPVNFNTDKCNTFLPGWTRTQKVDFVYFDVCGNASVSSAVFGVIDTEAPDVADCPIEILRNVNTDDCITPISLNVPIAADNCGAATSPVVKNSSIIIKSSSPGSQLVIVDSILVTFTGYNPNAFTINGPGTFSLELFKVDADNDTEFFRVYDENGNLLGNTNNVAQQCESGFSDFGGLSIATLNNWIADGTVSFKLVPNVVDPSVLSINDICTGSRLNSSLSFPIDESNLVQSYFTIEGSGDTTNTTKVNTVSPNLTSGVFNASFVFTDCAQNETRCDFTINVRDILPPVIDCNNDTIVYLKPNECGTDITIPLNVTVEDNCRLSDIYYQIQPSNPNNSLITFKYLENENLHVANNKSITFQNLPKILHATNEVSLEVNLKGDINNATEYFDILGEGGLFLGRTNRTLEACGSTTTKLSIPKSTYNTWASDGNIIFTAVANNNVNEEGFGINSCIPLSPNQSVDNISTMTMRLIVSDATIRYSINNGPQFAVPQQNDSFITSLNEGGNTIRLFTDDNYGNEAQCQFEISVRDTIRPTARCKNFVARIHPSGLIDYVLSTDSLNNNSTDNCAIDTFILSSSTFNCSHVGTEQSITLTAIDVNGNSASCASLVKFENTILKPSYTSGLCEGDTLQLFANLPLPDAGNVYTFEWKKDGILVSNLENPAFISNGQENNGLYTIKVSGFNGCTAEGFIQVNIQPLALPLITVDQSSYCLNEPVILESTEYFGNITYDWYEGFPPGGTLLSSTTIPQLSITPAIGIHNYYVIVKNDDCTSSASPSKRVTIYNKPIALVDMPFQTVCEGKSITLSTTSSGLGYSYNWTGPMYGSTERNPAPIENVQLVNQGLYELVIKVGECESEAAVINAVVLPKPGKPVISGENIYCEGSTLSLAVTNLSPQEKYYWLRNGIREVVTQANFLEILNVQANASGSWQVIVESNTCLSDTSDVKGIEIADLSIVGATNTGPHCEGDSVTLTATAVPNAIYSWTGPGFSGVGPQVKALAKQGEYVVSISTASGCSNTTSTTVEVNKAPIVTALSNNSSPCMDGNTDIVFSPSISPIGNYIYKWTSTAGNMFTSDKRNAEIKNAKPSDNGEYTFVVFNKNCPSIPVTTSINIALIPEKASIIPPGKICEGENLILTTSAIADTFIWNTPLGIVKTTAPSLTLNNVSKTNAGNYHLLVNKNGCTSTDFEIRFIAVSSKPSVPLIIGNNDVCFGDTILLRPSSVDFDKIRWTLPNGQEQNSPNIFITAAGKNNAGNYSIQVSKDDCESDVSQAFSLNVRDELVPSNFTGEPISTCSNDNTPIELCLDETTLTAGASYTWNDANGNVINSSEEICRIITGSQLQPGNNFIYSTTTLDGCDAQKGLALLIIKSEAPAVQAQANIDQTFVCNDDDIIQLISAVKEPAVEVSWKALTAGVELLTPNDDNTLVNKFREGNNIIVLSYSKDGCIDFTFDTIVIRYNVAPVANDDVFSVSFNNSTELNYASNDNIGTNVSLTVDDNNLEGTLEVAGNTFNYTPRTGFAGVEEFTYTICIEGCSNLCDIATVRLEVGENIECMPPTIFTPNNDGINDAYQIPCIDTDNFRDNELYIYNQWGDQVFHAKPYDNSWQGTFGGNDLPVGTYYFVFNAGNGKSPSTGFLILQR